MLIDGFTVAAQIVNFFILVALMKVFLYRPILKAMADRERKIAERSAATDAERQKADSELAAYRKRNQSWDAELQALQTQAKKEVDGAKGEMLKEAHQDVALLKAKWQSSIAHQKVAFLKSLKKRVTQQVYATARRALSDLANRDLEMQITAVFIEGLERLDQKKWKLIGDIQQAKGNQILIESAFALPAEQSNKIDALLRAHLPEGIVVDYKTEANLICGIALKVPGHKITWDLNDYLRTLEAEISDVLQVETQTFEKPLSVS